MTVIDAPSATRRDGSLNDVRAIIPDECYRRSNWKASVALISAAVLYAAPLVGLVLTSGIIVTIVLWVLAGLGVAGLFVLGHDASHGALLDSRRLNRVVAQLCLAPSAHAEAAWDLGHNRIHHGYTTREGFDFVWHPLTAEQYRELGRFARFRHRLEWSFAGAGIYYLRTVWWEKMWRFKAGGARRNAIVRDKVTMGTVGGIVLAATALVGLLLGGWTAALWWPLKLWVVPFLVFVHIIGWTVYVHHVSPEIRWWSRRDWSQYKGQMESTTVLRIPRLVNRLWFHNIFVHIPHHVDVRIPFHRLPRAAAAIARHYPDTVRSARISFRAYFRATRRCKLYDFERGCWVPYAAARA